MNFRSFLIAWMIGSLFPGPLTAYAGPKSTGVGTAAVSIDVIAQRELLAARRQWLMGLAVVLTDYLRGDRTSAKPFALPSSLRQAAISLGILDARVLAALSKVGGQKMMSMNVTLGVNGITTSRALVAARQDFDTNLLATLKNGCGGSGDDEPKWTSYVSGVTTVYGPFPELPPLPPPADDKPPQSMLDAVNQALEGSLLDDQALSGWSWTTAPSLGGGITGSFSTSTSLASFDLGPLFDITLVADGSVNAGMNQNTAWMGASTSVAFNVPVAESISLLFGAFLQTPDNQAGHLAQTMLFANELCQAGAYVGVEINF